MSYSFPPDVEKLMRDCLATGRFASEDEVLRQALRSIHSEQDDLAAIEEALADLAAGDRGIALEEAFTEVRRELGLELQR